VTNLISKFLYYFNLNFHISSFLYSLPGLILAFTIHEYSHGLAAYIMGDKTAKQYGRLTLNPIAHIDPLGFLCLVVTQRFGWAKPVPVNDLNFRDKKKGMLIVALAGPMSNFITALLLAVFYRLFFGSFGEVLRGIFGVAYIINLSIGVFNLIPITPLDGSRILDVFLSNKQKFYMRRYAIYSNLIIIILIFSGIISRILGPIISTLDTIINFVVGLFF